MGLLNNDYIYYRGEFLNADKYKNILKSRNIYNSSNQYSKNKTKKEKGVDFISDVINIIQPFQTYDLRNTVYGRLVTMPNNTPLVDIGLKMLGVQFAYNTKSEFMRNKAPNINLKNLFNDNNKVVTPNEDFGITKYEVQSLGRRFLNRVANRQPESFSPFASSSTHGTYGYKHDSQKLIDNTKPQTLDILSNILGLNKYFTDKEYYYSNRSKAYHIDSFGILNNHKEEEFDYTSQNSWINDDKKNITEQLVWGRDDVSDNVTRRIGDLRGINNSNISSKKLKDFKINRGLLEETNKILNSSDGDRIDITRKVFKTPGSNKIVGFQGSALWKAPDTSPVSGTVGRRQHTVLDQYDNFAKSIRFQGSSLYNESNNNSVINKCVIPRIHPTKNDDGTINSKNLMFSIENLAVRTIKVEGKKYGFIDNGDENIVIPASEIGPLRGRIMWFAPYDIQFSETVNNTFETTVMMGRGEPIYNYQYSERGATIRFKLLMDHPMKMKDYDSYKDIAEFFAFGGKGDNFSLNYHRIDELEEQIKKIDSELNIIILEGLEGFENEKNILFDEQNKLKEELKARIDRIESREYNLRVGRDDAILDNFKSVTDNKFYPGFHSQTPEDFHRRLTFLHQCMRQGRGLPSKLQEDDAGVLRAKNSVFGRQPVSVLRIGDFFHTKMIIEGLTIDYEDTTWDMNPEGFGMQPMIADITLNIKLIGGQSLEAPIMALQNAISFNHYANSTFSNKDVYRYAKNVAEKEEEYRNNINR